MNRDTAPRGLSWLIGPAIAAIGAALLFAGPGRATIPDAAPKIVPVALATHVTTPKPAMRTKAIEDVRVGERVLSRDQDTGRLVPGLVTEVYRRVSDHLRILEVRTASGSAVQEFRTTDEHPFWVEGRGWLVAGELHVGDELLCPNGERAAVASTRRMEHPEGVPVFNFRVDVHHDYFVAQRGDVGAVLVHNANYDPNKVQTPHTTSPSRPGKTGTPNSIHEQIRPDGGRSVTYFDDQGRAFARQDYGQLTPHKTIGLGPDGRAMPHEHMTTFGDLGPIGKFYRAIDQNGTPIGPWIPE
jgi:uncharacterized protein YwbE